MKYVNLFIIREIIESLGDLTNNNLLWYSHYNKLGEKYNNNIQLIKNLWDSIYCIEYDILPYFIQDLEDIISNSTEILNDIQKDTIIYKLNYFKNLENISNNYIYEC